MASSQTPWDEIIGTEAALTAYSMSMLFPVVIEHCREIDGAIATDIAALLERYRAYTKDLIDAGKSLAESGTKDLSSQEIGDKIDASPAQVKEFFEDPKNRKKRAVRHIRRC